MGVDWGFQVQSPLSNERMWSWCLSLKDTLLRSPSEFVYASEALIQFETDASQIGSPVIAKHYGFKPTHRWTINGPVHRSSPRAGDAGFLFALEFLRDHAGDCVYDQDGFGLLRRWHGRVMASAKYYGPGSGEEHLLRPPHVTVPVELDNVPWANLQRFDWPAQAGYVPPKPPAG